MDEHNNAVEIAVIKEQIKGIREQAKSHADTTTTRFDSVDTKLDDLTAALNRGKGAFAASMLFAGAIGALILAIITWALGALHK